MYVKPEKIICLLTALALVMMAFGSNAAAKQPDRTVNKEQIKSTYNEAEPSYPSKRYHSFFNYYEVESGSKMSSNGVLMPTETAISHKLHLGGWCDPAEDTCTGSVTENDKYYPEYINVCGMNVSIDDVVDDNDDISESDVDFWKVSHNGKTYYSTMWYLDPDGWGSSKTVYPNIPKDINCRPGEYKMGPLWDDPLGTGDNAGRNIIREDFAPLKVKPGNTTGDNLLLQANLELPGSFSGSKAKIQKFGITNEFNDVTKDQITFYDIVNGGTKTYDTKGELSKDLAYWEGKSGDQFTYDPESGLIKIKQTNPGFNLNDPEVSYWAPKMGHVISSDDQVQGMMQNINMTITRQRDEGLGFSEDNFYNKMSQCFEVPMDYKYETNTCDLVQLPFQPAINDDDGLKTKPCGDECPLMHFRDGNTNFDAGNDLLFGIMDHTEIILGKSYGDGVDWSKNPLVVPHHLKFHACGDFTRTAKRPVYSPDGDSSTPDQFVCQDGSWKRVTMCNDGVDNDGDGRADYDGTEPVRGNGGLNSDPACSSKNDKTETFGSSCEPRVGLLSSTVALKGGLIEKDGHLDRKVAFINPSGDTYTDQTSNRGCTYGDYQAEIPAVSQKELEFSCDDSGNLVSHPVTSTGSVSESDLTKGDIEKKMQYSAYQKCQDIAGNLDSEHNGEMDAAQITLDEKFVPFGTRYASVAGYIPFETETRHSAESSKIDSSSPHNFNSYTDKNIPDSTADPYKNPMSPSQFSNTWTVANVLAPDNKRVREGVTLAINPSGIEFKFFKGGYSPKCPEDRRWGYYNGKWQCLPSSYQERHDYILPDVKEESDFVGFKLLNSTFERFWNATGSQLDAIDGNCWRGKTSDKPANPPGVIDENDIAKSSLQETLKQELDGGVYNVKVSGVDTSNPGEYTCEWTLTDTKGSTYSGGSLFKSLNWFENDEAAQDIVNNVDNYVESRVGEQEQKKPLRKLLLPRGVPDYKALDNVTKLPDKVSQTFFESSGVKQ